MTRPGDDVAVIAPWNSTTVTLAAEHAGRQMPGILTLLVGIGALMIGAPFATNFRGALDRWDETPTDTGHAPKAPAVALVGARR